MASCVDDAHAAFLATLGDVDADYRDAVSGDDMRIGRRTLKWLVGHDLGRHQAGDCLTCDLERTRDWSDTFTRAGLDPTLLRMAMAQLQRADVTVPLVELPTYGSAVSPYRPEYIF